jgi:fimbrial chaperone protein
MIRSLLLFFALLSLPSAVFASSISLSPTSIVSSSQEKSAALVLENRGDNAERYQVSIYAWSQTPEGHDVAAPTEDLMAAPSVIEIPAKSKRAVRVLRVREQGSPAYYRLLLRQLPSAQPASAPDGRMRLLVNQDLPVAFEDPNAGEPVLSARFTTQGVLLSNDGAKAGRLTSIGPAGHAHWRQGALGWVLPGQSKLIPLKPGLRAPSLSMTVNGKPLTVQAK